jgi:biopolymer transport protein ExbD
LTIVLRTQAGGNNKGMVTELEVQQREGSTPILMKQPGDLSQLLPHLKKVRGGLANPKGVKVQADPGVRWSQVIAVVDLCKQAQFQDIGFLAPPKDR